jgi:uncharacterized phage infection (PIP) family protein YhgE
MSHHSNHPISSSDVKAILQMAATWRTQLHEDLLKLMTGLDNLTQAISGATTAANALTQAVDGAVSELNAESPTDAQLNTLADSVTALQATLTNQAQRLNDAVNPPTPAPAPTPTPAPATTAATS